MAPKCLSLEQTSPMQSRLGYPAASVNSLLGFLVGISYGTRSNMNSWFPAAKSFSVQWVAVPSFSCSGLNPYCHPWFSFNLIHNIQTVSLSFYPYLQSHQSKDHFYPPTLLPQYRQYCISPNHHGSILTCFP